MQRKNNLVTKYRLSMVREAAVRYPLNEQMTQPARAAQVLYDLLNDSPREQAVVLFLNVKRDITGYCALTTGTKSGSLVHVGEVFTAALYGDAHSVIFGHNHPSGHVQPSKEDTHLTERLRKAGQLLQVELVDHVIVASGVPILCWYSFATQEQWS